MRAKLGEQIEVLAARQHGVVTRAQLLEIGLSGSAVGRRLKSGRLRPLHLGVYRLALLGSERTTEMAAVLAGGPGAVLSHASALHVWGLLRSELPRPVHVTVGGGGRSRRPGIVFHRTSSLAEDERSEVDRIPVTSPARTIVDAAAMLGTRELEQAMGAAEREGLVSERELGALPDRYAHRPGLPVLRALVGKRTEREFTRSEAERRCLELIRAGGLPIPHTNVSVGPYELDLLWPREGIAVEVDSWAYHSSRSRFEGDRRKDNWLRARGIEVIRVSWHHITRRATETAVLLGQSLVLARARAGRPGGTPRVATPRGKPGGTPQDTLRDTLRDTPRDTPPRDGS